MCPYCSLLLGRSSFSFPFTNTQLFLFLTEIFPDFSRHEAVASSEHWKFHAPRGIMRWRGNCSCFCWVTIHTPRSHLTVRLAQHRLSFLHLCFSLTMLNTLIGTEQGPPAAVQREAGHLDLFWSVSLDALIGIQQASKGHTSTSLLLKTNKSILWAMQDIPGPVVSWSPSLLGYLLF